MHYCFLLFTKELPSKEKINEIMQPYNWNVIYGNEENENESVFTWDWYSIGGRYGGKLKLKNECYDWRFGIQREGKLFYSGLLEKIRTTFPRFSNDETSWMQYMISDDGYLNVDGAKISDIKSIEDANCFGFIDVDGKAYARESWINSEWVKNENFEKEFATALENNKDGFVTVLDVHD